MMRTLLPRILLLAFLLFHLQADAQLFRTSNKKYFEVGFALNAVNYSGDLAEDNVLAVQTRYGLNGFARYHLSQMFHLRANIGYSYLYADDKHSPTHVWRTFRFTNNVIDLGIYAELNFARIIIEPSKSKKRSYLMIYGLLGPSVVFSHPDVEYYGLPNNPNIDPRFPGEGKDPKTNITYCWGGGVRWLFGSRFSLGIEASVHPVFGDWLDGVSSFTGDPKDRDWYFKAGLTFAYFINRDYRPNTGEY